MSRSHALTQLQEIEKAKAQHQRLGYYFSKKLKSKLQNISIPEQGHEHNTTFRTINDKDTMHKHIQQHSQQHFQQAEGSPPTTHPLGTFIGDGLDQNSEKILNEKKTFHYTLIE